MKGVNPNARSRKVATKGVQSFRDVGNVMSALMSDVLAGDVTPSAANKLSANVGQALSRVRVQGDLEAVPAQAASEQRQTAKRDRGEGSIRLRDGSSKLQLRYYRNGVRIEEPTPFSDTEEGWKKARKLLRKRLGEVAAGITRDSRGLRYEDLRDAYVDAYELSDRNKALRHGKESGQPYLESVRRLDGFFEGFRAIEIGPDEIRQFQRDQRAAGLANGTINRSVAAVRRMFNLAAKEEKLRHVPHFPMLGEARPRNGTLPHGSYASLLKELPDYLRPVVTIGFRTGMRLGEILNLRWSNVLWLDSIIRLEDSKNGEPREIPFTGELETVLREQFAKRQVECDRVCFRVDRRGHARAIGNFRKPWRRACVKIALGRIEPVLGKDGQPVFEPKRNPHSKPKPKTRYAGLIFHDLRRTFVTDAEHAGAPRHEVMKVTGHRTESVYKRYAIENREQRRAALAQVDEYRAKKFGDSWQ